MLTVALWFGAPAVAQEGAVIVTVDGLNVYNTFLPGSFWADIEHYLRDALVDMDLAFPADMHSFPWSRDALDTVDEVDNLKSFIVEWYNLASAQGKQFIIVSHSWGTFLSYAALSQLSEEGSPVFCDLFITLGSPLGTLCLYDDPPLTPLEQPIIDFTAFWIQTLNLDDCDCSPSIGRWVNYWAWADAISGPIDPCTPNFFVEDHEVDNHPHSSLIRNNPVELCLWHDYDSLQPASNNACPILDPDDNQPLLDAVQSALEQVVLALPGLVPAGTSSEPNVAEPGDQITLFYGVSNPSPLPFDLFLGASIRPAAGGSFINSLDCEGCGSDALVRIQGGVDQLFTRCFTIPPSAEPGLYEVCYAIWDPTNCGPGVHYDGFCRDELTVLPLPCDDQCTPWVQRSCGGGSCPSTSLQFTRTCPAGCGPVEDCRPDPVCKPPDPDCLERPCPCEVPGYGQCFKSAFGDCDVSIAVNYYSGVGQGQSPLNDIRWGAVVDSSDPYVIGEYRIGWTAVDAEKMYYGIDGSTCDFDIGGCNGERIADTGTRVTVVAPGIAHTDEVLGYDDTAEWACWVWFNAFTPSYNDGADPIYVLRCYDDGDCGGQQRCDKTGSWDNWSCVNKKPDGAACTDDAECASGFCDNDGVGAADDGWCFMPWDTYFDGEERSMCEVSTGFGSPRCDERQVGEELDACIGIRFREDQCSDTCAETDITSVFECGDAGCFCEEPLCDGLADGDNIATCSSKLPYFADRCTAIARGTDRGDNVCRSAAFAPGCTGAAECDGVVAGTGNCSLTCQPEPACGDGQCDAATETPCNCP